MLPPELPLNSDAAAFLTSVHQAFSTNPSPGTILRLALPRREDYKLSPLPTIALDVPKAGSSLQPSVLDFGSDFANVQVPPRLPGTSAASLRRPAPCARACA